MAYQLLKPNKRLFANAVVVIIGFYLIITSTFFPLSFLYVLDAKRILQLLLILFCTVFAISWAPLRQQCLDNISCLPRISRVILLSFFAIGIISSLRLAHPMYPLLDVAMLFLLFCMIVIVAASRNLAPQSFDKYAVVFVVTLGLAVFIQELMGFVAGWIVGNEFSYETALIHFAHPRFYNQLQTWTIPVIAALPILFPKKRWLTSATVFLLGLQWFLAISFAARGTIVSLVLASVFVAFWLPGSRKFWLKTYLLGLLSGIILYLGFLFLNSVFIPESQTGAFFANSAGRSMMHTTGRSALWALSIQDAIHHPWLGSGPTQYACDSAAGLPAHPHNFVLQILGEWGFLAASLMLALGFFVGVNYLKALKSANPTSKFEPVLNPLLAMSLLAGLIHSCLSGLLIMPASQVTLILIAGWVLSLSAAKPTKLEFRFPRTASATLIMSVLVAFTVLTVALSELNHLTARTSSAESFGAMPRFWQSGRVCEFSFDELSTIKK